MRGLSQDEEPSSYSYETLAQDMEAFRPQLLERVTQLAVKPGRQMRVPQFQEIVSELGAVLSAGYSSSQVFEWGGRLSLHVSSLLMAYCPGVPEGDAIEALDWVLLVLRGLLDQSPSSAVFGPPPPVREWIMECDLWKTLLWRSGCRTQLHSQHLMVLLLTRQVFAPLDIVDAFLHLGVLAPSDVPAASRLAMHGALLAAAPALGLEGILDFFGELCGALGFTHLKEEGIDLLVRLTLRALSQGYDPIGGGAPNVGLSRSLAVSHLLRFLQWGYRQSPAPEDALSYALGVHAVKQDMRAELDALSQSVMEDFKVSDFEELLTDAATGTIPAYPFHTSIMESFRKLFDAHTDYSPPWDRHILYYRISEDKAGKLELESIDGKVSVKFRGKALKEMGGQVPFEFIQQQANERVGQYKSLGGRVNSWLQDWNANRFKGGRQVHYDGIKIVFQDGEKETLQFEGYVKDLGVPATSFDAQWKVQNGAQFLWILLKGALDAHLDLDPKEASVAFQALSEALASPDQQTEEPELTISPSFPGFEVLGEEEEANESVSVAYSRRLGKTKIVSVGFWPASGLSMPTATDDNFEIPPLVAGYWLPESETAVLKLTSLMPQFAEYSSGSVAVLKKLAEPTQMRAMLKLHKKLADKGGKRIIIDLSSNGGGMVELAHLFVQMILPHLQTPVEMAGYYNIRMGAFWDDWISSFGWPKRKAIADRIRSGDMPQTELDDMVKRLENIIPLDPNIGGDQLNPETRTRLKSGYKWTREELADGLEGSMFTESLIGEHKHGWAPFTDFAKDPETGEAFDPFMKPFVEVEEHEWGNKKDKYSGKYFTACSLDWTKMWNVECPDWGKHQWEEIAVLTDGKCGSACATVAAKLQFSGGATVFTHGGVPKQSMDSSAFGGGNVERWPDFWHKIFYAGLIGDAIHGKDTKIGQRLRQAKAKERHYSRTLPLPMPTEADVSMTYRMMYVPEMGENALPREWYSVGAHRHYDDWNFADISKRSTYRNLFNLYANVASEDWAAIRAAGVLGSDTSALNCAKPPLTEFTWAPQCTTTDDITQDFEGNFTAEEMTIEERPLEVYKPGSKGLKIIFWLFVCLGVSACWIGVVVVVVRRHVGQQAAQGEDQPESQSRPHAQNGRDLELQTLASA
mmetsp:Transcript_93501/g.194965  ORF Transcript_93501/g.194965 Transcript_93501/m.194965 type:complete len:1144 (+) Transcript_93501:735-4166(+)